MYVEYGLRLAALYWPFEIPRAASRPPTKDEGAASKQQGVPHFNIPEALNPHAYARRNPVWQSLDCNLPSLSTPSSDAEK
eukprot:scaffold1324_cov117-Isochrysis_galbana.AAC.11